MKGISYRGNRICFGRYALQALEPAWITSRQIEAGRRAMTRNARRGGKIWRLKVEGSKLKLDLKFQREMLLAVVGCQHWLPFGAFAMWPSGALTLTTVLVLAFIPGANLSLSKECLE
ncbi:hypothetical protein L1049_006241 [Liquidambar formosana]|uniref:50S ribosomal protein L16, chloroplastic n=1 Tax=Liquidambar formosana TaxID=63359 RepID=A0AAP0RF62_LIQFO